MKAVARVSCHIDIAVPEGGDPGKFAKELDEGLAVFKEAFPPEWGEILGATADDTRLLSGSEIQQEDYAKELTS